MMKKTIVTIACCALVAPLAFAKEKKTKIFRLGFVEQGVTVSGTAVPTVVGGAAASYQPAGTLIVNQDGPGRYVLNGRENVLDSRGNIFRGAIKPGTRVQIYFADTGGIRSVDHVVVNF